jgi:hypothetical protein
VTDPYDDFASDVQTALQQQVVRALDRAREAVLDGRERIIREPFADGREERLEGRTRHQPHLLA